jgi:hypothetical protein
VSHAHTSAQMVAITFSLRFYAGTMFHVPLVTVDDSPPMLGNFPVNSSGAEYYFQSLLPPFRYGNNNS